MSIVKKLFSVINTLDILLLVLVFFIEIKAQVLFTYVNSKNDQARVALLDEQSGIRTDIGINKTFLPAWLGEKILLESTNFIWVADQTGDSLVKLCDGFRAVPNYESDYYAYYSEDGICLRNSEHILKKKIEVSAWSDIAITWTRDDKFVVFYNKEKQQCQAYGLSNDSIITIGEYVYQPVWSPTDSGMFVYNYLNVNGNYEIRIGKGMNISATDIVINRTGETPLVPQWSEDGKSIAYLSLKPDSLQSHISDLWNAYLIVYDIQADSLKIIDEDASYTDLVFPQLCYDKTNQFIYYTGIGTNGNGSLVKIKVKTGEKTKLTTDEEIDERFPILKR